MRLSFALPALAGGLLFGWSALAATTAAPTPPAAPIFYCPSSPKPAAACAAAAPAASPAPAAKAAQAARPAAQAAPAGAVQHRRVRHRYEVRFAEGRGAEHRRFERRVIDRGGVDWRAADLSEGQRFVHDYERRHHGFDVGGEETWAHAGPPCPDERGCPPPHAWAEAPPAPPHVVVVPAPPQPQQVVVARAPPPPPQVIVEREAPPPPKIIIEHPPAPPPQIIFERAPAPPPRVIYERGPACPDSCPPPGRYGWQDREGGGVVIERRERERAGGWRYDEENGRGHYQAWGDGRRGRRCPPRVPEGSCSSDAGYGSGAYESSAYESGEWRDGSYGSVRAYAGRDAQGYLVWPGK
jgi:hypothetical protein